MNEINLIDILNTFILITLFWYQKNKNKLLNDRINEQSKLLSETKNIITNQATAIESQQKVVDTALKYSETFNYDKIETIIKKELDLEYQSVIQEHKDTITKMKNENPTLMQKDTAEYVLKLMAKEYIAPLLGSLIIMLLEKEPEDRVTILDQLPNPFKDMVKKLLEKYDKELLMNDDKTLERNKWKVRLSKLLSIN
ncbi:hypothetical protein [Arcobacter sp. F2176]|uniref:hypothetical protein n=1 Tax=Arcobacter sp. F2176 TaxID=2044511 RepID=UPI00100B6C9A|nr:hypothetical protein [Arcobacter sp. F2176]RXJ81925.1 hypothetical protein CRU95_03320 [Arcobacter sp. F2176]